MPPGEGIAESPPRTASFFRTHPGAKWLLPLLAIALSAGIFFVWLHYAGRESTDDAQINGHIIPISARVGGYVERVYVRENEAVKAGQLLLEIDPADYRVAVAQAKAAVAEAQAGARGAGATVPITSQTAGSQLSKAQAAQREAGAAVVTAQEQLNVARADASARRAQLQQAEANLADTAQDLERYKFLVSKDEISRQRYDSALAAEKSSKAAVDAARDLVAAADQSVAAAQAELTQARAREAQSEAQMRAAQTAPQQVAVSEANASLAGAKILQKEAALDSAELNLQYTYVKAPIDGIIGEKHVEAGMNVQSGQPLLSVVPLQDIWVTANFKERQLESMHPGQKAVISVDAYGGRKYQGYVESIAPATGEKFSLLPPENATGNYVKVVQRIPVRLRFDQGQDPNHLLRPGMSVTATVITK